MLARCSAKPRDSTTADDLVEWLCSRWCSLRAKSLLLVLLPTISISVATHSQLLPLLSYSGVGILGDNTQLNSGVGVKTGR